MMTQRSQDVSLFSKCNEKFLFTATVGLIIFCFTGTITALVLIFVLLCPKCSSPDSLAASIYWGAAIFLLCIGVGTLVMLLYLRKTGTVSNRQAVICRVPTADLEKSPTPVLNNNHIPQRRPCDSPSPSIDLPDYFTAIQVYCGVNSTVNVDDALLEEVPRTPPPCYEMALELAALPQGQPPASIAQDI